MTLDQLNQHFALLQRRRQAEELLASMRSLAEPSSHTLSGMPRASAVRDRIGDLAAEIADISAVIESLNVEIEISSQPISVFIDNVSDVCARMVLRLRFIRGLEWKEVATYMGRGFSAKRVSDICYRTITRNALEP